MLYILTIAVLLFAWWRMWSKYQDVFHPFTYFIPQFIFLFGWLPIELVRIDPDRFHFYTGGSHVYWYHSVAMALVASLLGGVVVATRRVSRSGARWLQLEILSPQVLRRLAAGFGVLGFAAFYLSITNAGGFEAAYGSAYGNGKGSGFVKEFRFVGLIGALFIYLLRVGKGMRLTDWAIILLCVAPTLLHGLIGARRGPTFLALIVLGGGYVYFMRKRISLIPLIAAGGSLGIILLFLVANRGSIYLGSEMEHLRDPLEFLLRWSSNEYLTGSAVIRYAEQEGAFYGIRELCHIIGRILPKSVWPEVYTDLPRFFGLDLDLSLNRGLHPDLMATITGWSTPSGSVEGFAGGLFLEFGYLAPAAAFCVGFFYGKIWLAARDRIDARVLYVLMMALSIYLVMQSFDAWFYRLVLFGLPAALFVRLVRTRRVIWKRRLGGGERPDSSMARAHPVRMSRSGPLCQRLPHSR